MSWQIAADIREMFVEVIATDGSQTVYGRNVSRKDQLTSGLAEALNQLPPSFKASEASLYIRSDFERISIRENWGGHAAFLTTEGFENLLEIDDQSRSHIFGLHAQKAPPLISRDYSFGVTERIKSDGSVETVIDEKEIDFVISKLAIADVKSVAICLLHSKINPAHEVQLAQKLRNHGYEVVCSHQFPGNELERAKKACAEAFVWTGRKNLIEEIAKLGFSPERIFVKNGNEQSLSRPSGLEKLKATLSGPAHEHLLTGHFLEDRMTLEYRSGQKKIIWEAEASPLYKVYIDEGHLVHVGPERIDSEPGPVCFNKGIHLCVLDLMSFVGKLKISSTLPRLKIDNLKVQKQLVPLAKQLQLDPETCAQKFLNLFYERVAAEIILHIGQENLTASRFETGGWLAPLIAGPLARRLSVKSFLVHRQGGWLSSQVLLEAKTGKAGSGSWGALEFDNNPSPEGESFEL